MRTQVHPNTIETVVCGIALYRRGRGRHITYWPRGAVDPRYAVFVITRRRGRWLTRQGISQPMHETLSDTMEAALEAAEPAQIAAWRRKVARLQEGPGA